jgi:hypothetical protein
MQFLLKVLLKKTCFMWLDVYNQTFSYFRWRHKWALVLLSRLEYFIYAQTRWGVCSTIEPSIVKQEQKQV